ncbi:MAG: helicase-exonuclease AddAB subunit AddA, partial [Defluviitaleaceae bacterium]|nr:helicase-exonuclease AddAB subunit AddA [Defluviitaleaceae bacterium]
LTFEFARRFNAAKRLRNMLDFSDLEHLCLGILVNPEDLTPTEAARELREQFEHIMIDEYQDSNGVQEMMLQAVAREANLFMVGDVKQSIYRFRSADPSIFRRKYAEYSGGKPHSLLIDLHDNFRSRPEVLETANLIFRQIMSEASCGISYGDNAALIPFGQHPISTSSDGVNPYRCEILLGIRKPEGADYGEYSEDPGDTDDNDADDGDTDTDSTALEAEIAALRILDLVRPSNALSIFDTEQKLTRPAGFGDIVILKRTTKQAAVFAEVFARKGIPLDIGGFGGKNMPSLLDCLEVSSLIDFLRIIDNPRQDIPLAAVLSGPVYNLSPDELLEARAAKPRADFLDALTEYVSDTEEPFVKSASLVAKLRAFLQELDTLRETAPYMPLSSLIAHIYDTTDYDNIVSAMPMGGLRTANLRLFEERAAAFEDSRGQGLFHFTRYIDSIREHGRHIPAAAESTDSGSVRLMTVHKSKGLEFPIVFVCNTSRRFNFDDLRGDMLFHKELGLGAKLVDAVRRTRADTLSHSAVRAEIRNESLAEEMRMLYVAMTRAREKLIITGCVNSEAALTKFSLSCLSAETALDASTALGVSSMQDWILMSLARHKRGAVLRTPGIEPACSYIRDYPADFLIGTFTAADLEVPEAEQDAAAQAMLHALRRPDKPAAPDPSCRADVEQALRHTYPHSHSTLIPSKLSITEIKRIYQAQMQDSYAAPYNPERYRYRRPDFRSRKQGLSPTEIGTAIHTVMEHMDLHAVHEEAHVRALLESLTARNILRPEELPCIPVKHITNFARSPLAKRMRVASALCKEIPFVLAVDPSELYTQDIAPQTRPILVHGIVDTYFIENGQAVIVDYKSDYIAHSDTDAQILAKYRIQLEIYRKAIERAAGLPVKDCILYMLRAGKEISLYS